MFGEKILKEEDKKEKSKTGKTRKTPPRTKLNSVDFKAMVKDRAYEIHQERVQTNQGGDELSDWLQAEEELRQSARSKM